jgi:hypothetical protein
MVKRETRTNVSKARLYAGNQDNRAKSFLPGPEQAMTTVTKSREEFVNKATGK